MVTGALVTCHLCGRSLRSVTAHLRTHGWTKQAYCEAFGLERGQSLEGHWTVNAIAAEVGLTHHSVEAALRRHGLARTAHAAKRHQAHQRAAQVAARLGFDSMTDYVASRRGAGRTWRAMAAECAQPPSWLRRQAQATSPPGPR